MRITFLLCLLIKLSATPVSAQIAWMEPATGNYQTISTIYVDVSQSENISNSGLKEILTAHPDEVNNVYLWAWQPSDPVIGNGNWENSTEQLKMTWISDLIFSIQIIPSVFFATTESEYYDTGISLLAKLDNGSAYAGNGFGEAKTEDLHIDILASDIKTTFISEPIIYPNPCRNELNVQLPHAKGLVEFLLYDCSGGLVHSSVMRNPEVCKINTIAIQSGFYHLTIKADDQILIKKISILHD